MNESNQTILTKDEKELFHLITWLRYLNYNDHTYNEIHKILVRLSSPRFESFNINALNPLGHTALSLCLDYRSKIFWNFYIHITKY
jgi:hypothetical protein